MSRSRLSLHPGLSAAAGLVVLACTPVVPAAAATTTESAATILSADTTPPVVTITYPQAGQTFTTPISRITGTADDPGGSGVAEIRLRLMMYWTSGGGTYYNYWDWISGGWTATWDPARVVKVATGTIAWEVNDGLPYIWTRYMSPTYASYRAYAYAVDNAGNSGPWVSNSFRFLTDDVTPPAVTITCPESNKWYYPGLSAITGTADDGDGVGVGLAKCELGRWDLLGMVWKAWDWETKTWVPWRDIWTDADGPASWAVTAGLPSAWPEGRYVVRATATDRFGASQVTPYVYFNIGDNVPPTGRITCPEQDAWYYPGPDRIAGTAADGESGVNRAECYLAWYDSAAALWRYWNWATHQWETVYSDDWMKMAEGTETWLVTSDLPTQWARRGWYYVGARVFDNAGNAAWVERFVSFNTGDNVPPTGRITYPEQDAWYCLGPDRIAGTAADGETGVNRAECYLCWYDSEGDFWWTWNWETHQWETDWAPAWWKAADGTETWQVTSDLPTQWACRGWYYVGARVFDNAGNAAWVERSVSFYTGDTVPPTIHTITADPAVLWPPNHRMVDVQVLVTAADNCDPAPVSRIISVTCSEPADAPGSGSQGPDWEITGDLALRLRSERAGPSTERVYTITVECRDRCGNATTGAADVMVPHDQEA